MHRSESRRRKLIVDLLEDLIRFAVFQKVSSCAVGLKLPILYVKRLGTLFAMLKLVPTDIIESFLINPVIKRQSHLLKNKHSLRSPFVLPTQE